MAFQGIKNNDLPVALALSLPLLVRFYEDGPDGAAERLVLVALAFVVAYGWSALFEKQLALSPKVAQLHFAMLFAILLPEPVGWGGVVLATSFGWVFGREVFGGRAIVSPVLVALAFAIFSFPDGGFEVQWILSDTPNPLLAIACLPGAAWLLWKKAFAWPVVVGVAIGGVGVAWALASPSHPLWWDHALLGTFSVGILFIASMQDYAPRTARARWVYGLLIGALIVSARLANPDQPDGVIFAILLGSLFAPLLDRILSWNLRDG